MKCNNCGHENIKGAAFCAKCGTKIEIKKFKPNFKLVIIPFITALIIFAAFKLWNSPIFNSIRPDDSIYSVNGHISVEGPKGAFYVDKEGRKINDQVYYWNSTFIGNYALVSYEKDSENFYVINKDGKTVKTIKDTGNQFLVSVENEVWILDGKLYDKNLKQISDDNQVLIPEDRIFLTYKTKDEKEYGVLDKNGKVMFKRDFPFRIYKGIDPAEDGYLKNRYCLLYSTSSYHSEVVNCKTGKVIIENEKYRYKYTDKGVFYYNTGAASAIYYLISDDKAILSDKVELDYMYDGFVAYKNAGDKETTYYNLKKDKELSREEWQKTGLPTYFGQSVRHFIYSNPDIYVKNEKVISGASGIKWPAEELSDYIEKKTGKRVLIYKDESEAFHIYDLNAKKDIISFDKKYTDSSVKDLFITPFIKFSSKDGSGIYYNLITNQKLELMNSTYDYTSYNSIILTLKNGEVVTYNSNLKPVYTLSDADNVESEGTIPVIDELENINIIYSNEYKALIIACIAISIISMAGMTQMFRKANQKWYEALIPGYNLYICFKIAEIPFVNILFMFIPILNFYVIYILTRNLLKNFGKSTSLTVPAMILTPITFMYLGFSKAEYKKEEVQVYSNNTNSVPISEYVTEKTEVLNFEDIITPSPVSNNNTISSEFKICPKCGTKIKATEQACFICGTKF